MSQYLISYVQRVTKLNEAEIAEAIGLTEAQLQESRWSLLGDKAEATLRDLAGLGEYDSVLMHFHTKDRKRAKRWDMAITTIIGLEYENKRNENEIYSPTILDEERMAGYIMHTLKSAGVKVRVSPPQPLINYAKAYGLGHKFDPEYREIIKQCPVLTLIFELVVQFRLICDYHDAHVKPVQRALSKIHRGYLVEFYTGIEHQFISLALLKIKGARDMCRHYIEFRDEEVAYHTSIINELQSEAAKYNIPADIDLVQFIGE